MRSAIRKIAVWVLPKATQLVDFSFMIAISTAINWLRQGDYMTRLRLLREGKSNEEIRDVFECETMVVEAYQHVSSYQEYLEMSKALTARCPESCEGKPISVERW